MFTNSELPFFREKIAELNTAVFFNESRSVLKIPNNIISIHNVDEVGQIWFFVNPPQQCISEFEQSFYMHLQFFKKGCNFFLRVDGKAYLVTDPEEINSLPNFSEQVKESARNRGVLVKVKVSNLAYYEMPQRKKESVRQPIASWLQKLLPAGRPSYRFYRLEPDPGF